MNEETKLTQYDDLLTTGDWLKQRSLPVAITLVETLVPTGGKDTVIFPPTFAFKPGLFPDLPAHTGDDVLAGFELASQAVVFPEVRILGPAIAVNQQDALAIGRKDVAERGEDGGVGHGK